MKTLNIFISKVKKEELSRLSKIYKLSMSSVADIISYNIWKAMKNCTDEAPELLDHYLEPGIKTSIKPKRILNELENLVNATKMHFVSNAIVIYFNNDLEKYITDKGIKKCKDEITRELKETKEDFWNYNKFTRMQWRYNKQNGQKA